MAALFHGQAIQNFYWPPFFEVFDDPTEFIQETSTVGRILAEFDFEVEHRPRKSNVVADALPRLNIVDYGAASKGISEKDLFKGLE